MFVSILISRYVGMYLYLYVVFYISIGYPGMWCLLLYFHLAFVVVFIYGICIFTCYPDNYCLFMYIYGAFYFYWVSWYLMFIFHTLYLIFIFHISSPRYTQDTSRYFLLLIQIHSIFEEILYVKCLSFSYWFAHI